MRQSFFWSILVSCATYINANSLGAPMYPTSPPTAACDVNANYGCSSFNVVNGVEDRINGCKDVDAKGNLPLMYWAKKTVRSNGYTLSAAGGAKSYTPGGLLQINLAVHDINLAFTGIMLYAVDANEKKIGSWTPTSPHYHTPWENKKPASPCAGTLFHSSAQVKPLFNTFQFTAPPAGTGKITFRCLIKEGIANTGAFYNPMAVDLSLTEGTPAPPAQAMFKTAVGQSCSEFCSVNGFGSCDKTALASLTTRYDSTIAKSQICALPFLLNCDAPGASTGDNKYCYNACAPSSLTDYCTVKSSNTADGNRFCQCTGSGGSVTGGSTVPTASTKPLATTQSPSSAGSSVTSNSSTGTDGSNNINGDSDSLKSANGGSPSSSGSVSVPAIAGGIGGGAIVIGALLVGLTIRKKRSATRPRVAKFTSPNPVLV